MRPVPVSEMPPGPLRKLVEARRHILAWRGRPRWDSLGRELVAAADLSGLANFSCAVVGDPPAALRCEWAVGGDWMFCEVRDIAAEIDESLRVVREVLET